MFRAAAGALLATAGVAGLIVAPPAAAITHARPNIVVIVTDDQVEGTMDAMPETTRLIKDEGVSLTNGLIPTSLCCPSRTALLSSEYSHTTGVYRNTGRHGGWPTFYRSGAESDTFAVALKDAGYQTALFGKYLNGFGLAPEGYVPPGWDTFRAIFNPSGRPALASNAYYDYVLRGTGDPVAYGSDPQDYSTDVLTGLAVDYIKHGTSPDTPFLLYYATTGPHAPFVPAPRHIDAWHVEDLDPAASTLTSGRAKFWPDRTVDYAHQQELLRRQHETLMSVDEGVAKIVDALGDRASNTLFVFLSDNGQQFGEHGLEGKDTPFSGSTDVPMFLRWDGVIDAGTKYSAPVTNADIGATIVDAAGATYHSAEGVSFFTPRRPSGVQLEAMASAEHPAYCGWRTRRYLYVEYADNRGRELFDYRKDPHELKNRARLKRYTDVRSHLRQRARAACQPVPPGFSW